MERGDSAQARRLFEDVTMPLLKQVQALPKLANSTVAYEMLDYTDEQIQRIESDAKKAQAGAAIASLFEPKEGENGGGAD